LDALKIRKAQGLFLEKKLTVQQGLFLVSQTIMVPRQQNHSADNHYYNIQSTGKV